MNYDRLSDDNYIYYFNTGSQLNYELEVSGRMIYIRVYGTFKDKVIAEEYVKYMKTFGAAINYAKNRVLRDLKSIENSYDEFEIMRSIDDVIRYYKFS